MPQETKITQKITTISHRTAYNNEQSQYRIVSHKRCAFLFMLLLIPETYIVLTAFSTVLKTLFNIPTYETSKQQTSSYWICVKEKGLAKLNPPAQNAEDFVYCMSRRECSATVLERKSIWNCVP